MLRTNRNFFAAGLLADELSRSGVRHIAISPGSRSSPLAMTFAADTRFRCWSIIDERSAAFFALGVGKSTGVPAAVICTSGTAVANLLPAVVEASYANVPLLVLTADRPPELRETGANQAIDQVKIFGGYPRWFSELGLPEATADYAAYARNAAARAVASAVGARPGPVHLNVPFRDPLAPVEMPADFAGLDWDVAGVRGRPDGRPWVEAPVYSTAPAEGDVADLASLVRAHSRGFVLAGAIDWPSPGLRSAVAAFAARSGFPILAEPLSGLRFGPHDRSSVVAHYDAFLRDAGVAACLEPEVVIRIGASTTSKVTPNWLDAGRATQVVIDPDGGWSDPGRRVSRFIRADIAQTLAALAERVEPGDAGWLGSWTTADRAAAGALTEYARRNPAHEGAIAAEIVAGLPDGSLLVTAPSMPIRDLEAFAASSPNDIVVIANRGANGIDGVLSTAIGVAASQERPVTLLTGDIAFLHDAGSLLTLKRSGVDLTILVVNNNGGGIFSFLPQAAYPEGFAEFFTTPHGLDLGALAAGYGIPHRRVQPGDIGAALGGGGGQRVVEVVAPAISDNVAAHREAWAGVSAAVRSALGIG